MVAEVANAVAEAAVREVEAAASAAAVEDSNQEHKNYPRLIGKLSVDSWATKHVKFAN